MGPVGPVGTVVACAAVTLVLAGCATAEGRRMPPSSSQGVAEVIEDRIAQESGEVEDDSQALPADDVASGDVGDVDIDLMSMSPNMVLATVYDMMQNRSAYVGKTIRMDGDFYHNHLEDTGMDYYFCIVRDATACCAQGIEFVWDDGSHVFPDDYPKEGTEIVVTGTFATYDEGGATYVHLVDCSLQAA